MGLRYDTITFLSDYGRADEFVGVVHSVIRSISPEVAVIDLTHDVERHDVRGGALALARSAQYLCPGIVLAVVDPGVGTDRRAVAVEVGDGQSVLLGPDNGLLAPAVAMVGGAGRVVELTNPEYRYEAPGPTFDGRDVFAPAAAHLARGVDLTELGPPVDPTSLTPGTLPVARPEGETLVAEVIWVDRFGNAQLNVDPDDIAEFGSTLVVRIDGDRRRLSRAGTYAEVGRGDVGLVVDSYGLIGLAADRTSAATLLSIGVGSEIVFEPDDAAVASMGQSASVRLGATRSAQPTSPGGEF